MGVVKALEEMIAEARAGHIQAIAFAVVWDNGSVATGWSEHYDRERLWHAAVSLEADLRDKR